MRPADARVEAVVIEGSRPAVCNDCGATLQQGRLEVVAPVCCSGDRAERIAAAGEQSVDIDHVTCVRCRVLWQRSREDHDELHAHRRDFEARVQLRGPRAVVLTTLGQAIEPVDSTLRVELASVDRPEGGERDVALTPREALRLGRVLVAWGTERGGDRG